MDVTINGTAFWDAVPGAAVYDVISEKTTGEQIALKQDLAGTSTPILGLVTQDSDSTVLPPGTYRFKVRSQDSQGNVSVWSTTYSFNLVAPPPPGGLGVSG
jgi:hypothetical protein